MSTMADITVPFDELHDTVEESPDMMNIRASKAFLVAWGDRIRFYKDVLGHREIVGNSSGTITINVPLQYPDMPFLYATAMSMEPWGPSSEGTNQIQYTHAKVTVGFTTVPWNFQGADDPAGFTPNTYMTESIEMAGEIETIPASALKFQNNASVEVKKDAGRIIPTANISVAQHQAPYIPFTTIFSTIGTVNSDTFYGVSPGYMLFVGAQSEADTNIIGYRTQKLTMKFAYRSIPWNQFALPSGNGWDYLIDKTTGNYVYPTAAFAPLLFT